MEKFRKDFEERNLNEMIRLSSITTPQHLEENDLAKTLRRNKFTLRICSYSFELFISFLQQSNYMIILALTNQYLDLKVFSGHPTTLVEEEYKAITGTGSRPEPDQTQGNQKPVLFGMLQDEPRRGVKKEGEEYEPKPAITRV
jgi:hypothetical protein